MDEWILSSTQTNHTGKWGTQIVGLLSLNDGAQWQTDGAHRLTDQSDWWITKIDGPQVDGKDRRNTLWDGTHRQMEHTDWRIIWPDEPQTDRQNRLTEQRDWRSWQIEEADRITEYTDRRNTLVDGSFRLMDH